MGSLTNTICITASRETAMKLRACLFFILCCWFAVESKFSPSFFVSQVQLSLAEMQNGLDNALSLKNPVRVQVAPGGPVTVSALD